MFAKEIKRTGRGKSVYDFRALSFCGCCCGKCYAIERHFRGKRYKVSPIRFSRPESLANQGIFRAYCVTGARLFLMRSAACLRVIRFRQTGQYLTLLEVDAKNAPHSVHFFLPPKMAFYCVTFTKTAPIKRQGAEVIYWLPRPVLFLPI